MPRCTVKHLSHLFCASIIACYSLPSFSAYQSIYNKPERRANSFLDILKEGHTSLYFRGRYEYANDDSPQPDSNPIDPVSFKSGRAYTLTSRLAYTTAQMCNFWGLMEFNNVSSYWNTHHNSGSLTTPQRKEFAEIPDAKGTSLNQALIAYQGLYNTQLILGRQKIKLDNGRYVGSVDFRQTPQSFDAITIENKYITGLELFYSYIDSVNTVLQNQDTALFAKRSNHTHLFNSSYDIYPFGTVTGYFYYIKDQAVASLSNSTYGLRYNGSIDLQRAKFLFVSEYAFQSSNSYNPVDYNAEYYLVEGAFSHPIFDIGLGYEWLEGNKLATGKAFITPLSDYHIFNGWADKFSLTPALGLTDLYLYTNARYRQIEFEAAYHNFHAEANGIKFGHEIDLGLSYSFLKYYKIYAAFADFRGKASNNIANSQRFWLSLSAEIA